jgi:hypothetical protein
MSLEARKKQLGKWANQLLEISNICKPYYTTAEYKHFQQYIKSAKRLYNCTTTLNALFRAKNLKRMDQHIGSLLLKKLNKHLQILQEKIGAEHLTCRKFKAKIAKLKLIASNYNLQLPTHSLNLSKAKVRSFERLLAAIKKENIKANATQLIAMHSQLIVTQQSIHINLTSILQHINCSETLHIAGVTESLGITLNSLTITLLANEMSLTQQEEIFVLLTSIHEELTALQTKIKALLPTTTNHMNGNGHTPQLFRPLVNDGVLNSQNPSLVT